MKMLKVGQIIKGAREKKGLTIDELAKKSGYSKEFLEKVEAGETEPDFLQIVNIMKTTGEDFRPVITSIMLQSLHEGMEEGLKIKPFPAACPIDDVLARVQSLEKQLKIKMVETASLPDTNINIDIELKLAGVADINAFSKLAEILYRVPATVKTEDITPKE